MFNSVTFKKNFKKNQLITQQFSGNIHIGIRISEMESPSISEQPMVSGKGIYLRCMSFFKFFFKSDEGVKSQFLKTSTSNASLSVPLIQDAVFCVNN